ncbi:MAG: hypothetical protein F6K00_18250 [Leptolyngbya sp. SIOISBB]|nr:hypothetical protein [Leptolyngbya sp. SIOISBB]
MAHLKTLQSVIEKALEDDQFEAVDIDPIQPIIWADGKVTDTGIRTIHDTIHVVMGAVEPSLSWLQSPQ